MATPVELAVKGRWIKKELTDQTSQRRVPFCSMVTHQSYSQFLILTPTTPQYPGADHPRFPHCATPHSIESSQRLYRCRTVHFATTDNFHATSSPPSRARLEGPEHLEGWTKEEEGSRGEAHSGKREILCTGMADET